MFSILKTSLGIQTDDMNMMLINLKQLLDKILKKLRIRDYGVKIENLPYYVDKVYETQQRLLNAGYIRMSKKEFLNIYKKAY